MAWVVLSSLKDGVWNLSRSKNGRYKKKYFFSPKCVIPSRHPHGVIFTPSGWRGAKFSVFMAESLS